MSKPVPVQDVNFDQAVLQSKKPVLVDMWATWCRPCQMVAPIVDELAEEYADRVHFFKLDVDQNPQTPAKYGVMSIPTLIIFKNGSPVSHIVGFRPKTELKRNLDAVLD
ncbi:MAG: thioredoxin [Chloroflexi bacterium]|nr:thioredoxin [Chloroflexota bacterium]